MAEAVQRQHAPAGGGPGCEQLAVGASRKAVGMRKDQDLVAFEACYLRFAAQFFYCQLFLCFIITINCFLFIAYPEQWRIEYIHMPLLNKIGKELQEECHEQ